MPEPLRRLLLPALRVQHHSIPKGEVQPCGSVHPEVPAAGHGGQNGATGEAPKGFTGVLPCIWGGWGTGSPSPGWGRDSGAVRFPSVWLGCALGPRGCPRFGEPAWPDM